MFPGLVAPAWAGSASPFVATLYALSVAVDAFAAWQAFAPMTDLRVAPYAFVFAWLVSERTILLVCYRVVSLLIFWSMGTFRFEFSKWLLALDLIFTAFWLTSYASGFYTRKAVEHGTLQLVHSRGEQHRLPHIPKLHTPEALRSWFWPIVTKKGVVKIADIVYATPKECEDAGPFGSKFLKLDLYHHESKPTKRPVLLLIHGGGWMRGDKRDAAIPQIYHVVCRLKCVVVSVNYRLSPSVVWPAHFLDVKKALRWVKNNIEQYGGDPNLVIARGNSAGGHMASMLALTANDPAYQEGFTEVDTSVAGCIAFYPVVDMVTRAPKGKPDPASFFEAKIAKKTRQEYAELFRRWSPIHLVGPGAPPFMLVHGARDNLVPCDSTRQFANHLRTESRNTVVYIELPQAHHSFDMRPGPRTYFTSYAVEMFIMAVEREHLGLAPKEAPPVMPRIPMTASPKMVPMAAAEADATVTEVVETMPGVKTTTTTTTTATPVSPRLMMLRTTTTTRVVEVGTGLPRSGSNPSFASHRKRGRKAAAAANAEAKSTSSSEERAEFADVSGEDEVAAESGAEDEPPTDEEYELEDEENEEEIDDDDDLVEHGGMVTSTTTTTTMVIRDPMAVQLSPRDGAPRGGHSAIPGAIQEEGSTLDGRPLVYALESGASSSPPAGVREQQPADGMNDEEMEARSMRRQERASFHGPPSPSALASAGPAGASAVSPSSSSATSPASKTRFKEIKKSNSISALSYLRGLDSGAGDGMGGLDAAGLPLTTSTTTPNAAAEGGKPHPALSRRASWHAGIGIISEETSRAISQVTHRFHEENQRRHRNMVNKLILQHHHALHAKACHRTTANSTGSPKMRPGSAASSAGGSAIAAVALSPRQRAVGGTSGTTISPRPRAVGSMTPPGGPTLAGSREGKMKTKRAGAGSGSKRGKSKGKMGAVRREKSKMPAAHVEAMSSHAAPSLPEDDDDDQGEDNEEDDDDELHSWKTSEEDGLAILDPPELKLDDALDKDATWL